MAPSPTGEYHVGHLRTLLYNYAFAKKEGGKFILRIEDTDRTRFVEGAVERILSVIKDYGFDWDEGPEVGGPHEPYIQSERLGIYKKYAQELVEKGHAYYCFCTEEDLKEQRDAQLVNNVSPKYDKRCIRLSEETVKENLDSGKPYVVRLNVPPNQKVVVNDIVYGEMEFDTNDIDDQVLLKSDGFPTYHLAVVVDDYLMEVSHVLRGNDWLPSTPKHVLLYRYFEWDLPTYVHLPNLREDEGTKKLSKRYGAVTAREFLEEGYLPDAILNFLMFLGWNPGTEKEIYTLDDFIRDFTLEKIHKTDLVSFDRKKLLWLNGQYIRHLSENDLWKEIKMWSEKYNVDLKIPDTSDTNKILYVVRLIRERLKLLSEFPDLSFYFFNEPNIDVELLTSYSSGKTSLILGDLKRIFKNVDETSWKTDHLDSVSHKLLEEKGYKPKEAFMTLRVAISGVSATPPIFDTLECLGKDVVLERIDLSLSLF
jgi:glutamyl-tRNA synthetase